VNGLTSGARVRVPRGAPTPEEALALLLAIDQATTERPAARRPASWRWAARLEGVSITRVAAAADLEAARRRPLG
jgi:hypothetical protein